MFKFARKNINKIILSASFPTIIGISLYNDKKNIFAHQEIINEKPIVIVGGGIMGSSIAASIASKGGQVILIDESHNVRSSWGDTRGLQNGYTGIYGKLVRRSKRLWEKLQLEDDNNSNLNHGRGRLFFQSSNMLILPSKEEAIKVKNEHVANGHGTNINLFNKDQAESAFSAVKFEKNEVGFVDYNCLAINAPECLNAMQDKAEAHGAIINLSERVDKINTSKCELLTNNNNRIQYSKLILASGPWTNRTLKSANLSQLPIFVSAEQLLYLEPKKNNNIKKNANNYYSISKMPVIDGEITNITADGVTKKSFVYCFPMVPGGKKAFKCAVHCMGEFLHTSDFHVVPGSSPLNFIDSTVYHRKTLNTRQPNVDEIDNYQKAIVTSFVKTHLPTLNFETPKMICRCLYTSAIDLDFIIGPHPEDKNVIICTGFRGEGFKFAPVIGDCVSEIVLSSSLPKNIGNNYSGLYDDDDDDAEELKALTEELLKKCTPARFF